MLRARDLEKKIRRLLRQEYDRDPDLKKQARQARKGGSTRANWLGLFFLTGLGSFVVGSKAPGIEAGLAFVTLWCTLTTLSFTHFFRSWLNFSADLWLLARLPVKDSDLFGWLSRRALRQTFMFPLALLMVLGFLGLRFDLSAPAWAGLALAILVHWWLSISVALLLLTRWPAGPYQFSGWIQAPLLFAVFLLPSGPANALFERLQHAMDWVGWLLPAGWINHLFAGLALRGDWQLLILLLPIGFLAGYLLRIYPRLRDEFTVPPWILELWPDHNTADLSPDQLENRAAGPTEITDQIRQRHFLAPRTWAHGGPVERWAGRCLKPSERSAADLMLPDNLNWSKQVHRAALTAAIGLVLAWILPNFREILLGATALLTAMAGLPWLGGQWQGFLYLTIFGTSIPLHALLPVSLRQFVPVYLKLNLVRHLAFLPVWLAYGTAAFVLSQHAPAAGLVLAAKLWVASLLLQPALFAMQISSTTNDSSRLGWRMLPLGFLGACMLGLGIAGMVIHSLWTLLFALVFGLLSFAFLSLYLRWFEQNRFDTCRRPDPGQGAG